MKRIFLCVLSFVIFEGHVLAKCTKEQAKKAVEQACALISTKGEKAKADIQTLRFCGDNYVWVQDKDVNMVLHPIKRRLNGKSLKGNKDENGKLLFVEMDKAANANAAGGWVEYVWPKPGAEKATPKISFVKKCEGGLGWVAGAGVWK